jgi:hypothetical protein
MYSVASVQSCHAHPIRLNNQARTSVQAIDYDGEVAAKGLTVAAQQLRWGHDCDVGTR